MITAISIDQSRPSVRADTLFPAIVGFFFSFRMLSVVIGVRVFYVDPQTGVAVGLALNFVLLGMAAFNSIGPGSRTLASFASRSSFRWALVFLIFSGSSLLWTSAVSIPAAAVFWSAMTSDFAIVVLLLRLDSTDSTALSLMKGFVWGACAVAVVAWLIPMESDLRLGDEELLGPNQIGYVCAFAFFLAQYLVRRGEKGWVVPSWLLAITLLRSLSKTTIIAFAVAQTLMLVRDRTMSRRTKIYFSAAAVLVIAAFWSLLEAYVDVYMHAGNQSETLTGRIGIWAFILNEALQQPWIGHGFHSVWKVIPPFGAFEARHAHNELLQQFYAYGAAGVCIFVALYWSVFREIRRIEEGMLKTFLVGLFLFVIVRGFADTEVFDLSLPIWSIVMIGSIRNYGRSPGFASRRVHPASS